MDNHPLCRLKNPTLVIQTVTCRLILRRHWRVQCTPSGHDQKSIVSVSDDRQDPENFLKECLALDLMDPTKCSKPIFWEI